MLALYIIGGIILFVVLGLLIPVEVVLDVKTGEDKKATTRVGWLFGLVSKEMHLGRRREDKKKPEKKRKEKIKLFLSVLRTKGLPGRLLTLARRMLSCLKVRELDASLRVGLDDPADTGMMYSVLQATLIPLNSSGTARFRMEPSFDEPAFEAGLHGRVRLVPIQMVAPLLRFVLSLAGWRTIRSLVVLRWKK